MTEFEDISFDEMMSDGFSIVAEEINLNDFKTLRILLLFFADLGTLCLNARNLLGTVDFTACIEWHGH